MTPLQAKSSRLGDFIENELGVEIVKYLPRARVPFCRADAQRKKDAARIYDLPDLLKMPSDTLVGRVARQQYNEIGEEGLVRRVDQVVHQLFRRANNHLDAADWEKLKLAPNFSIPAFSYERLNSNWTLTSNFILYKKFQPLVMPNLRRNIPQVLEGNQGRLYMFLTEVADAIRDWYRISTTRFRESEEIFPEQAIDVLLHSNQIELLYEIFEIDTRLTLLVPEQRIKIYALFGDEEGIDRMLAHPIPPLALGFVLECCARFWRNKMALKILASRREISPNSLGQALILCARRGNDALAEKILSGDREIDLPSLAIVFETYRHEGNFRMQNLVQGVKQPTGYLHKMELLEIKIETSAVSWWRWFTSNLGFSFGTIQEENKVL